MKKEIGGYMEFERLGGSDYYPDLYKFNLGRTALVWLLEQLNCRRLYVPCYCCDSVAKTARNAGFEVELYHIDEKLRPISGDAEFTLEDGEWLYLVNFYGQLTDEKITEYRKQYGRVIVDNAQSFFQRPVGGLPTIYSCRKFIGVSDGAYLDLGTENGLSDETLKAACEKFETLPVDITKDRIGYLFGRLEENARNYYSEMLAQSDKFADAAPMKMSLLTENILRGIDYERVRERRVSNYLTLQKLLPSDNPFTKRVPIAPFAYPYYHEDGLALRKAMAAKNIFIPTNWSYLVGNDSASALEQEWSANILPLPVDQRYGEEEMTYLAKMIREYGGCC